MIGFDLSDDEKNTIADSLTGQASDIILSIQRSQAAMVVLKMKKKFEIVFCYDDSGLPRQWKKTDDIHALYSVAKKKGMEVLASFATFQLDETSNVVVISDSDKSTYELYFKEEVDHMLRDAEWKQTKGSETNMQWWIIILIVILGWNEFMAILSNPLLLLLCLAGGIGLLFYNFSEMDFDAYGPLGTLVKQFIGSKLGTLTQKLESKVSVTSSSDASAARPMSNSEKKKKKDK